MFKVTRSGPDRVDIQLSGKLDAAEMKVALDELVNRTENIEHGRMLYRIDDFEFPTLGAMGVELSRIPELFRLIGRFDRAAVLVDEDDTPLSEEDIPPQAFFFKEAGETKLYFYDLTQTGLQKVQKMNKS